MAWGIAVLTVDIVPFRNNDRNGTLLWAICEEIPLLFLVASFSREPN